MEGGQILQKQVKPNPAVVFTDLEDGSAVLLDLDSKFYYSLNETGCFMWQIFEDRQVTPIQDLLDDVIKEYEVAEEDAQKDIEDFIGDLAKEGLVELS